jgi:hypothetical protein
VKYEVIGRNARLNKRQSSGLQGLQYAVRSSSPLLGPLFAFAIALSEISFLGLGSY